MHWFNISAVFIIFNRIRIYIDFVPFLLIEQALACLRVGFRQKHDLIHIRLKLAIRLSDHQLDDPLWLRDLANTEHLPPRTLPQFDLVPVDELLVFIALSIFDHPYLYNLRVGFVVVWTRDCYRIYVLVGVFDLLERDYYLLRQTLPAYPNTVLPLLQYARWGVQELVLARGGVEDAALVLGSRDVYPVHCRETSRRPYLFIVFIIYIFVRIFEI